MKKNINNVITSIFTVGSNISANQAYSILEGLS